MFLADYSLAHDLYCPYSVSTVGSTHGGREDQLGEEDRLDEGDHVGEGNQVDEEDQFDVENQAGKGGSSW